MGTMMVRCGRCGYSWEYRGKSKYYATCPCCLRKVKMINPPRRKK